MGQIILPERLSLVGGWNNSTVMVRVFVALELPKEIQERLKAVQEILRGCPARLTFVDPPLIHITLKFLGEVAENEIPCLGDALRSVSFRPFPVTVGSVTVNSPKRPHVVWSTISDGGQGKELLKMVENSLEPLGFPRENRAFTPHATLARVKVSDPSLFSLIGTLDNQACGSCTISGMKLKKSTLTPGGPVYEDLLEVVF